MIQTLFGSVEQEPSLLEKVEERRAEDARRAGQRSEDALQGKKEIDADLLDELEGTLISADIGVRTTEEILERIRQRVERHQLADAAELKGLIREQLLEILAASERAPARVKEPPAVVLVVGVNGSGKTTTIGKLAAALQERTALVLLCAADTFRAAAIEQLEIWGQRTGIASDPAKARQRPQRGAVRRRAAGAKRAQSGLRDRGHRRPPADQGKPDGGAAEDEPHREAR
jgi:fused signal recognition particle receptor